MHILITLPKEFEEHYKYDHFRDSLERVEHDVSSLNYEGSAGRYDIEVITMLIKAFWGSRC